ncbi:MAG: hypothetical protein P1U32_08880 [Legionellaceae bacterium]|nr:hypothetical protein [Legionellaceae bacterium]
MHAEMQALQETLEQSEWDAPEVQREKQARLLKRLVHHAVTTTTLYQKYDAQNSIGKFQPLLRKALQGAMDSIVSHQLPAAHGETYPLVTSGSTGEVVRVLGTGFTRLFYDALMLREHRWHQRDVRQKLMAIRWLDLDVAQSPQGTYYPTWGAPIDFYKQTGPSVLLNVTLPTHVQMDALVHHKPYYLMTYPSQLQALAQYAKAHDILLPDLHEIRTIGEMLTDKQVALVNSVWPHANITDVYSCVEIGGIAQQCPEYKQYHVNAEHVYLEIVNDANEPCGVGEVGRVLVTSLMNYATPLIRYELGDYAAFGAPCPCGRTLPVLQKIVGRKRNRLVLQNGETRFPYLGEYEDLANVAPIRVQKFQVIQHTLTLIEIKVVSPDRLTTVQRDAACLFYQSVFGAHFNIDITYHNDIASGPAGKFEEFISCVEV